MDLLSGLLLLGVVMAIIAIIARELFDDSITGLTAVYARESSNPVENSLVGSVGRIIEVPEEEGANLRIRIGTEIWSARLRPGDESRPTVGSEVKVTAVDGMILNVEENQAI